MPSLSKLTSATLALTTVFLRGTAAAAIEGGQLEFCDFDRESQASPAPSAARRRSNPERVVFPDSPLLQEKPNADAPHSSAPAASPEIPQDVLDSVFNGKPPPPAVDQEITPDNLNSLLISLLDEDPLLPRVEQKQAPVPTPAVGDGRELKVGVYMHIVGQPENDTSPEFFLSRDDLDRQITAMNEYYTPANISFQLLDADWTRGALPFDASGLETAMAHNLRKGNRTALNVFWLDESDVRYGGTSKTFVKSGDERSDGIIVNARSVPGGSHPKWNLGVTAVHEAGHWLSLAHTVFDIGGYCEPDGETRCGDCDYNFMSYGDDACLTEFTPQQINRMRDFAINKRGL